jgi:predicted RNase H-like nuclease (RuvC/YqgF family)
VKLDELRKELDSDARQRCETQEKTIKDLIAQNKHLLALLDDRQKDIEKLQNICLVATRGAVCLFCNFRNTCSARRSK